MSCRETVSRSRLVSSRRRDFTTLVNGFQFKASMSDRMLQLEPMIVLSPVLSNPAAVLKPTFPAPEAA